MECLEATRQLRSGSSVRVESRVSRRGEDLVDWIGLGSVVEDPEGLGGLLAVRCDTTEE